MPPWGTTVAARGRHRRSINIRTRACEHTRTCVYAYWSARWNVPAAGKLMTYLQREQYSQLRFSMCLSTLRRGDASCLRSNKNTKAAYSPAEACKRVYSHRCLSPMRINLFLSRLAVCIYTCAMYKRINFIPTTNSCAYVFLTMTYIAPLVSYCVTARIGASSPNVGLDVSMIARVRDLSTVKEKIKKGEIYRTADCYVERDTIRTHVDKKKNKKENIYLKIDSWPSTTVTSAICSLFRVASVVVASG